MAYTNSTSETNKPDAEQRGVLLSRTHTLERAREFIYTARYVSQPVPEVVLPIGRLASNIESPPTETPEFIKPVINNNSTVDYATEANLGSIREVVNDSFNNIAGGSQS